MTGTTNTTRRMEEFHNGAPSIGLSDDRIREMIVAYLNETKPILVDAKGLFTLCRTIADEACTLK